MRLNRGRLADLVSRGFTQRQIARRMNCSRAAVSVNCSRLGLKTIGCDPSHVSRVNRCNALRGVPGLSLRGPLAAAKLGWPRARTAKGARVLRLLLEFGSFTAPELFQRRATEKDYVVLNRLLATGLVGKRREGKRVLWMLADGVIPGRC